MHSKPQFRGDGVRHAIINGQRFHLKVARSDGDQNLLWINGKQPPLILDKTATDFVAHLIDAQWKFQHGEGDRNQKIVDYVVDRMFNQYKGVFGIFPRVSKVTIKNDLDRIFGTLMGIANGDCPRELGLQSQVIQYANWSAPARMDLAVTYRCNLKCSKCYNGDRPAILDMSLASWVQIYEKLWQAGIPQVVFTGGEPLMRDDIINLVSEADRFFTGLITNGTLLASKAKDLKAASLDYVQVTIESHNPDIHDSMTGVTGSHILTVSGIKKALEVGLWLMTNTTLTAQNALEFTKTVKWLHTLGVKNVACNGLICTGSGVQCKIDHGLSYNELTEILKSACLVARSLGMTIQWFSPTCYSDYNPLVMFGPKSCSAASHNMAIQPNGTVLPCQSWPNLVGNILTDSWEKIWNDPVCIKLRQHQMASTACQLCDYFKICGGSCPLDKSPRKIIIDILQEGGRS